MSVLNIEISSMDNEQDQSVLRCSVLSGSDGCNSNDDSSSLFVCVGGVLCLSTVNSLLGRQFGW